MPSCREAVEDYIAALHTVNVDILDYQFQVEGGKIRLGHGRDADVQWSMLWHTPEEFMKLARRRRLNTPIGDPKKPY